MSPDGRWLGVATSNTQSSGSDLALIDLERWRWGDGLEQMESADTSHIGSFAWSEDGRLAGLRYRGQVIPGSPWVLEPGGRRPLALVEAEVGDLDQWNIIELAPDGSRVHVLGHQSTQCCGIEVQGDPFVATFDLATGTEISRISLPDVLIGQRHETVFESEDEYNILRRPAMVLSADGAHVYIVHADEDRISVVDWAAGSVRTEEIKRPASAFARFGAWLSSHLVTRAEAKGGLSRFKEARPSPDGTQLYVTGISEIACEGMLYTACVAGRPLGLQVIDIESMQLTAEFPDISRIAVSPDGSRLIGIGDESDFREIVNDHALRVGFGATIIDSGSLELIARVEPEVAFEDLAVSPDGQFAYLLSDGPGIDPNASYDCIEACTLLTVVDLSDSTVAATRTFDAITMQLVSIAPPAR